VRVNPEKSDLLTLTPVELGHTGNSSRCNRMIAAENERNFAGLKRLEDEVSALAAGCGDFLEVLGVGCAFFFLFRDGNGNVTGVFDDVSDSLETRLKPRNAHGGRTHINTTAGLAKVKRDADYTDVARSDAAERSVWMCHK
jgi:hypothetical protein